MGLLLGEFFGLMGLVVRGALDGENYREDEYQEARRFQPVVLMEYRYHMTTSYLPGL